MSLDPITTLPSITRELEASWQSFDSVYDRFDARQWRRKFGRTWTYAEQPWHLAYFDGMVAKYLAYGEQVPAGEKLHLRTMGEIDAWNARELARRGPDHAPKDSLRVMHAQRDAVRAQLARMTEADLDARAWMPLVFGWCTKRDLLQALIVHNVAEYWKLWLRTGKRDAAPSAAAVHLRLDFMMRFMPMGMNRDAAREPFTMVWRFEGPGGGAWTFSVAEGACRVSPEDTTHADLRITMTPENFHKIVAKMAPPPLLLLTGQMKVKGLRAMGRFARIFPEPTRDQVLAPSDA